MKLKYFLYTVFFSSLAFAFFYNNPDTFSSLINTFQKTPKNTEEPLIAITQIAPHPSLDLIRKGIEDVLREKKKATFEFQNAQGNIALATQIAQKFITSQASILVGITTPSAQALYSVLSKNPKKTLVFAAITDPESAKLLGNEVPVTGVSDFPPIEKQVDLILKILPKCRSVGVIYNPGESNSQVILRAFKAECTKRGIQVIEAQANQVTNISAATQSLIGKVQAFYLPNDNTVISALPNVLKEARNIPIFSSDPESVKRGCLASIAPDQYDIGRQVGELIVQLLDGKKVKDVPVQKARKLILTLNTTTAKNLQLHLTQELIKTAHLVS